MNGVSVNMFAPKQTPEERERQRRWRERHPESNFNPDPILIDLIKKSMPNLINYQICGVQPMSGPSGLFRDKGLVFTMGKPDYRRRIMENIRKMHESGNKKVLQNANYVNPYMHGLHRILDIRLQENSIEIVRG